jgi:hypothetical protein
VKKKKLGKFIVHFPIPNRANIEGKLFGLKLKLVENRSIENLKKIHGKVKNNLAVILHNADNMWIYWIIFLRTIFAISGKCPLIENQPVHAVYPK